MKSFDYYLQIIILAIVATLGISTIINSELTAFLGIGLWLLGAYQILHFIIYLFSKICRNRHVNLYMYIYPILVVLFFIIFHLLEIRNIEGFLIMYIIAAYTIGIYYFYKVHEKNLRSNYRIY